MQWIIRYVCWGGNHYCQHRSGRSQGIRKRQYLIEYRKYIKGNTSGGFGSKAQRRKLLKENPNAPKGQLYNLATDPGESINLFEQQPQKVAQLEKLLSRYRNQGYSRPLQKQLIVNNRSEHNE